VYGSDTPGITVVICTRNRGATVVRAVRTVLLNDYPHFAVIVVDQSDNESTREALQPFLQDPRVQYLRMLTRGLAAGRNFGIQAAQSQYIALTDDDCEVPRHWLRAMIEAFAVDGHIGVVFGNVVPASHDHKRGFVPAYERQAPFLARGMRDKHEVEGVGGCMGLRRSVWCTLGGFDEMLGLGAPFQAGEESDFAVRTLLAAYFVYETPAVHLVHHGFYTWDEGRSVVHRNWFGTGAMIVKHLKWRPWSVTRLLCHMAWRWAFARSRSAVALGRHAYRVLRLQAFLQGMLAGLHMPVHAATGKYKRKPE
jgi:GT2 family glycosyltransferase